MLTFHGTSPKVAIRRRSFRPRPLIELHGVAVRTGSIPIEAGGAGRVGGTTKHRRCQAGCCTYVPVGWFHSSPVGQCQVSLFSCQAIITSWQVSAFQSPKQLEDVFWPTSAIRGFLQLVHTLVPFWGNERTVFRRPFQPRRTDRGQVTSRSMFLGP